MSWKESKALEDKRRASVTMLDKVAAELFIQLYDGQADLDVTHAQMMDAVTGYVNAFQIDERMFPKELFSQWNQHLEKIVSDVDSPLRETLRAMVEGHREAGFLQTRTRIRYLMENLTNRLLDEAAHQVDRLMMFVLAQAFQNAGIELFEFIGKPSAGTCGDCHAHHGKLYRLEELVALDALPPLHPNCKCQLQAENGIVLDLDMLIDDVNPIPGVTPTPDPRRPVVLTGDEAYAQAKWDLEAAAGRQVDIDSLALKLYNDAVARAGDKDAPIPPPIEYTIAKRKHYTTLAIALNIWDVISVLSAEIGDLVDIAAQYYCLPPPGKAIDMAVSIAGEFIDDTQETGAHEFNNHELVIGHFYNGVWVKEQHYFTTCDYPGCEHYDGVQVYGGYGLTNARAYLYFYDQQEK